jgi:hypothetical protein
MPEMPDSFTVVIVIVAVVWLAITVAFGIVIAKMIRVKGSRTAAGSGVPRTLEHRADPGTPHAMTARARRKADRLRGAEPSLPDRPSA